MIQSGTLLVSSPSAPHQRPPLSCHIEQHIFPELAHLSLVCIMARMFCDLPGALVPINPFRSVSMAFSRKSYLNTTIILIRNAGQKANTCTHTHARAQMPPPSHCAPKVKCKKHMLALEHLKHYCIFYAILSYIRLWKLLFRDFNKFLLLSSVTSQSPTCYKWAVFSELLS